MRKKYTQVNRLRLRANAGLPALRLLVLACALVTFAACQQTARPPIAEQGVLDLREWDFERDGPVDLQGQWEFYWQEFVPPRAPASTGAPPERNAAPPATDFIEAPRVWDGHRVPGVGPIGAHGYATYRMRILLPADAPSMALRIDYAAAAYRAYWNEKQITGAGTVATDSASEVPRWVVQYSSLDSEQNDAFFTMQVSQYHLPWGGFYRPIRLGSEEDIYAAKEKDRLIEAFLCGTLLIMGLYHLGLYLFRRKDRAPLWFGLLCLTIVVRLLATGEHLLAEMLPELPWWFLFKLDLLGFYAAVAPLILFMHSVFPLDFSRTVVRVVAAIATACCLAVIFLSADVYGHTLWPFQIFAAIGGAYTLGAVALAAWRKRPAAKMILAGWLVFFATILNDILYNQFLIGFGFLVPVGLFAFTLAQAGALSRRVARAFQTSEELSSGLEQKVVERTRELELSRAAAERATSDVEKLAGFARALNASTDFENVITEIVRYLQDEHEIDSCVLMLLERETGELASKRAFTTEGTAEELKDYAESIRVPATVEGGLVGRTFVRQKPLYVHMDVGRDIFRHPYPGMDKDREILETLRLPWFVFLPLVVLSESIGVLLITSYRRAQGLKRADIQSLERFADQIAGAVHSINMLNRSREEREHTEQARQAAERAATELARIAEITRQINANTDLEQIIDLMFDHIANTYAVDYFGIYLVDRDRDELYGFRTRTPSALPLETEFFFRFRLSLRERSGMMLGIRRGRPFYIEDFASWNLSDTERALVDNLKLRSLMTVPLVIQREVVGIVNFSNYDRPMILNEDQVSSVGTFCSHIAGAVQSARQFQEVQSARALADKTRAEAEILADLARKANESVDLESILVALAQVTREQFGGDRLGIYVVDRENNRLTLPALLYDAKPVLLEDFPDLPLNVPLRPESGTLARTFRKKQSLHLSTIRPEWKQSSPVDAAISRTLDFSWFAHIPLLVEDEVIGILFITGPGERRLSRAELQFCERMGAQLAGAVRSIELLRQEQTARTVAAQMAEISRRVGEEADIDSLMELVFQYVQDFGVELFWFVSVDENGSGLSGSRMYRAGEPPTKEQQDFYSTFRAPLSPEAGALYRTYRSKRVLQLREIRPGLGNAADRAIVDTIGMRGLAHFPVMLQGECIGILGLANASRPIDLSKTDIERIQRFCDQIGGAIYNARLLKSANEARSQSEKARHEVEALGALSRQVSENPDLTEIIQRVQEFTASRFGVEVLGLFQIENENQLYLRDFVDPSGTLDADALQDFKDSVRIPLQKEGGALARCHAKQRAFYLPRISQWLLETSPYDRRMVEEFQVESLALVPLRASGPPAGILFFTSRKGLHLTQENLKLLQAMADQVAGAVENARMLEALAAEQERTETARREIEKLNEFTKKINTTTDLAAIIDDVFAYLTETYGFDGYLMMVPRETESGRELALWRHVDVARPASVFDYARAVRIPLDESGGIVARAFNRKRPLLIPDVNRDIFRIPYPGWERDREMIEKFLLRAFMLLPLVVQNETIAILLCASAKPMTMAAATRASIARFTDQIAGAVHTTRLLDTVQQERDAAQTARSGAEKAREQTQAMSAFARSINEQTDANIDDLLKQVFQYFTSNFKITNGVLSLADTERRFLRYQSHFQSGDRLAPEQIEFVRNLEVPLGPEGGTLARTFRKKKALYINRRGPAANSIDQEIVTRLNLSGYLHLPLVVREQSIGILWVESPRDRRRLNREEIAHLEAFTAQIAGAIHNAQLIHEAAVARDLAEKARLETQKMAEFARQISQNADLDQIITNVCRHMVEVLGFVSASVALVDERENVLFSGGGYHSPFTAAQTEFWENLRVPLTPDSGTLYVTYSRKKTLYVRSVGEAQAAIDKQILDLFGFKSFAQVPLIVGTRVLGILTLDPGERSLKQSELRRTEAYVAQIAGAVQNAQLLNEVQKERDRSEQTRREAERLNEIARNIGANGSIDDIVDQVFEFIEQSYKLTYVALFFVDDAQNELHGYRARAETAVPEKVAFFKKLRIPLDERSGFLWMLLRRKRPAFFQALATERQTAIERDLMETLELKSVLLVPLYVGQKLVGAVAASRLNEVVELEPDHVRSIGLFCQQIAGAIHNAHLLEDANTARRESEDLLARVLPEQIAIELKNNGEVEPLFYDSVSVLFTDFVGFTEASQKMMPDELVQELDGCFSQFDEVVKRNRLEKLKTIGDAYMCAAGLPTLSMTHAVDACLTALEFRSFMTQMAEVKEALGHDYWRIRIGIHSGPVTAGVIGTNKFAYDIWGDTVNTASRMESSGQPDRINISAATYELVKDYFDCEYRGKIDAKGKGALDMYFLLRIKRELAADDDGLLPNGIFREKRAALENPFASSDAGYELPDGARAGQSREGW